MAMQKRINFLTQNIYIDLYSKVVMLNFKNLFKRIQQKTPTPNTPPPEPKPYRHILSSQLGIPPAIYMIVYEMDLFSSPYSPQDSPPNTFLGTSCELALYEHQGIAAAAPVDRRRDEESKIWYLRRIREAVYFDKRLAKLTSAEVHAAFFPDSQIDLEMDKGTLFERRPALFYESSLENVLADTYRKEKDYLRMVQ